MFLKTQSRVKRLEMTASEILPLTLTTEAVASTTAKSQFTSHMNSEENPDPGALWFPNALFWPCEV